MWSLDGESHVLSMHVKMAPEASRENIVEVKRQVREILDRDTFQHITIDIEMAGEDCISTLAPATDK